MSLFQGFASLACHYSFFNNLNDLTMAFLDNQFIVIGVGSDPIPRNRIAAQFA